MKPILIVVIFTLQAANAWGGPASLEAQKIAKIFINSPGLVNEVKKNNTDSLVDFTAESIEQGVTKYTLIFERSCFCSPMESKVIVTEDLTPTYRDGRPEYSYSIEILKSTGVK